MPRWLLPWLFPLGLLVAVVAIATSTILAIVIAVVGGFARRSARVPLLPDQPSRRAATSPPRADPPNNRSLLR